MHPAGLARCDVLFEVISMAAILPVLQVIETGEDFEPLRESSLWGYLIEITETLNVPLSLPSLLGGIFVLILCRQLLIYIPEVYSAGVQFEVIGVSDRAFNGFLLAHLDHHDNIQGGRFVKKLTTELLIAAASISTGLKFIGHIVTCRPTALSSICCRPL